MLSIEEKELIISFLKENHMLENFHILSIVIYGSRITEYSAPSSDIDIFIIDDRSHSYRMGKMYHHTKFDLSIFSLQQLFFFLQDFHMKDNYYFEAIKNNHYILKDKENTFVDFLRYLDCSELKSKKRDLSRNKVNKIKDLYQNFLDMESNREKDYWYYNLLEMIRASYFYVNRISYINPFKLEYVYKRENCFLKKPSESFFTVFLEALHTKENSKRLYFIQELLTLLKIKNLEHDSIFYEKEEPIFLSKNQVLLDLLGIENNIKRTEEKIVNHSEYQDYNYYILLRRMYDFYLKIYRDDQILVLIKEAIESQENFSRITYLETLFTELNRDYFLDSNNYKIKLN